jgi:hypothetical protein
MEHLIASGRIVDLILGLMLLEAIAIGAYHAGTGRGIGPVDLAINLLAGVALLAALRAALTGADWRIIAAILAVAGLLHVADLSRRWKRRGATAKSRGA